MKKLLLTALLFLIPCTHVLSATESLKDLSLRATAQSILDNPEKFLMKRFSTSNVGELILPADLQEDLVRYLKSHNNEFFVSPHSNNFINSINTELFSPGSIKIVAILQDGTICINEFRLAEITDLQQLIAVLIAQKTGFKNITDENLRQKLATIVATLTQKQQEALLGLPRIEDIRPHRCVIL